jgi:precorrin-2 dehydrogenase / sirohydrochlorin ferrochelatase
LKALSCQFKSVFLSAVFCMARDRQPKPVKLEAMSLGYYPVMLNLQGRHVLFIGGGWETEIKIRGLLEAGAKITLLSTGSHPELEPLEHSGRIVWHRREYHASDLDGIWLVMSHPVDKLENHEVFADAEARGILCNSVDDPDRCSFILPSVLRRGDLVIGVSTSGTAPALGVRIKQRLAQEFGPEYTDFLALLRELRPGITHGFGSFETRKKLWYALIDSGALEQFQNGNSDLARDTLETMIGARRTACRLERCKDCTGNCAAHFNLEPGLST